MLRLLILGAVRQRRMPPRLEAHVFVFALRSVLLPVGKYLERLYEERPGIPGVNKVLRPLTF